ncbi:MAG: retropepsin-like aspartic protease [Cyanobacteria bacterium P01_A01_bin.137]
MLGKKQIRIIQILCLGTLAACQVGPVQTESPEGSEDLVLVPSEITPSIVSEAAASDVNTPQASQPETPPSTAYQDAINLASGAVTLGQQAKSPDDWDLIVGRWEQAIEKLKDVPADDQHYSTAQAKIKDYERNLAQAQQRLGAQPTVEIPLDRPVSSVAPIPTGSTTATATNTASAPVPIIERRGGTPVIEVTVNGRRYPMILDTGASHTHITRAMANQLGVQVVGQASVATASDSQAVVDVGYVDSIRVGNIAQTNMPVSIGDAVPIGLLGNDVYKNFDVILQVSSVEFRPR